MLSHLLLFRLATANTLAAALAFWAHEQGLVLPIFVADVSYLSYAIVALFVAGLASTFWRAAKVGAALDALKYGPVIYASAWRQRKAAKMHDKNAHVADVANWLMVLGLLGTVIGFAVALEGHGANDTSAIVSGLRTAIGTTILGGFLSLLTQVNFRMLDTATAGYVEDCK